MKKSKLWLCTLVALFLAGCTYSDIDSSMVTDDTPTIYARMESEESRVELNSEVKSVWTNGDRIMVYGDDLLEEWRYDGETGKRYATFKRITQYVSYDELNFDGNTYAHYPADNYEGLGMFDSGHPALFLNIKSEQTYHKDSFDPASNNMIGTTENGKDFYFKNLLGYLRLSITGVGDVKSIKLSGNNNEIIAGMRYYAFDDTSRGDWYDLESTSITLDCGDGVALSDTPRQFYFALMPTTFEKGITVEIALANGTTLPKSTANRIEISRNTIVPMQDFAISNASWQTVSVTYQDVEYVTAPIFQDKDNVVGYLYWGDDTSSLIGSTTSHLYDDGETEHTVTIKTLNANTIEFSNCEGMTDIDFTNF